MADATMKQVKDYFGMLPGQTLKDFTTEWSALSDEDKKQIKSGIGSESYTY